MRHTLRTAVLLAIAAALTIVKLYSVSTEPKYLPGSNRQKVVVAPADFDSYCTRTYPGSAFHLLSAEPDGLICSDRSSTLWQTQVIVPSDVCHYEHPGTDVVQTRVGDQNSWLCVRSTR